MGCKETAEFSGLHSRASQDFSAGRNRFAHPALRPDSCASTNAQVPGYAHLTADDHIVLEDGRTGDPYLPGEDAVHSKAHIVTDLAEVVDFAAVAHEGFAHDRSVDASAGAELYAIANPHAAKVRNFDPPRLPTLRRNKSESVSSHDHVSMQNAVGADDGSWVKHDAGVKLASGAHDDVFGELDARMQDCAGIHTRGALGRPSDLATTAAQDLGPSGVGVGDAQDRSLVAFRAGAVMGGEYDACRSRGPRPPVAGIGDEAYASRGARLQRAGEAEFSIGSLEYAAQFGGPQRGSAGRQGARP